MTVNVPNVHLQTAEDAKRYVLGGKSTFTLVSNKTNDHLTYKVKVANNNANRHFVWALTKNGYCYVGTIFDRKKFGRSKKSVPRGYLIYRAFLWAWRHIYNNSMPWSLAVYHYSTCCRCGHTLTDPKSIKRGIGPECIKMI